MLGGVKSAHREKTMIDDQERAAEVLDKAIAKVSRDEFNNLIQNQNLSDAEKVSKVGYALNQLDKLGRGAMPRYDEWVAPFYLSWHQPRQINLSYSMITDIVDKESTGKEILTDTGRLYVFDFGCGALAMQFGVALAIADALQKNQKIYSAYVVSYDKSKDMKTIGKKVWKQFRSEVSSAAQKDASLSYLEQACELIATDKPFRVPQNNEISWISAIHAAYDANQDKVKKKLDLLTNKIRPNVGFVTSHVMSSDVVDRVSPFRRNNEYKEHKQNTYDIIRGELPETTEARLELNRSLQNLSCKFIDAKIINYLNKPVTWEWPSAVIRIHTRR